MDWRLAYKAGTLRSARMRRFLEASEHFEDLLLLRELDTKGARAGRDCRHRG